MDCYDVIIIGGGPGGYTAALYAGRAGLRTLVLDRIFPAGQMQLTNEIDNYPGYPEGIDGYSLWTKLRRSAERFGAEVIEEKAVSVDLSADPKRVSTQTGSYCGRAVIYAAGAQPRKLGLPEEGQFEGNGLHYCAVCDGAFYRNRVVAVVGGGNSAASDALELSGLARRVILIHRRESLRADQASREKLMARGNVELRLNRIVTALEGDGKLSGLTLKDPVTGKTEHLPCEALFVSIGRVPQTAMLAGQLTLNTQGYIPADESTRTQIPGFFAVGDVRTKPLRQIVTAEADGATAAFFAQEYLEKY